MFNFLGKVLKCVIWVGKCVVSKLGKFEEINGWYDNKESFGGKRRKKKSFEGCFKF